MDAAASPDATRDAETDVERALGDASERRRILSTFRLTIALTAFFATVVVALVGLVIVLASHLFAELTPAIRADLEAKARREAAELVQLGEYAMVLRDEEQLARLLEPQTGDSDVLFAAVTGPDGVAMSSVGRSPLPLRSLFAAPSGSLVEGPGCIGSWAEARIEGNPVGRALVVVSTARVEAGAKLKREILTSAGFGGLLALGAVFAFVGLYVAPLIRVTQAAFGRLETATRDALEAARVKGEFVANVSHEIRTPMNGVLGMIELLRTTPLDERQARYTKTLRASATALMSVLNDVLDFSKIEADKMELRPAPASPGRIVTEVIELFEAQAELKNLGLAAELDEDSGELVMIDADRVKQVLSNLVGNAIKFTERGNVTVRVRTTRSESGELGLEMAVADSGVGIAEEALPRLFAAFSQVDGSSTRRRGGTGLGLVISRRIAELMGGTISVTSRPGEGSVFTLSFRAEPCRPSLVPRARETLAPAARPELSGRGRVLVAEDNPVNREVVAELLRELGCDADLVENGREALEALDHRAYALLLMDCQMPELDGYEATRRLRARESGTRLPVVAVTAHAFDDERERVREAGMDDFLTKPITGASLAGVLDRWLPPRPKSEPALAAALDPTVRRSPGLVRAFLKHVPEQVSLLRRAVESGDGEERRQLAHRLKGSCLAFGAPAMASLAHELEASDRASLVSELNRELERVSELAGPLAPPEARRSTTPPSGG